MDRAAMSRPRIALLAVDGESTRVVYHALSREFALSQVILEKRIPRSQFLRSRARRYGWRRALGQALFVATAVPLLERESRSRAAEVRSEFDLETGPMPPESILRVDSVNSNQTIEALRRLAPQVVVVNGTRIVSADVLASVEAPFINCHAGITPRYRGVHGGYWALAQGDRDHCGVTVHLLDAKIDTGPVLYQARVSPGPADNFCTYPLLQLAAGLPLLLLAVRQAVVGELRPMAVEGPSRLWPHPTLLQYVQGRLTRGVR
jgi:phosphoribosylglycinamide formyltransferase-1